MSSLLPEGKKIGRYEIRSQIGVGGMGEVYLAEDTQLDRKVALKILPPELALKQERMARFVREAKAAAALNHQTSRISTRLGNRMASTSLRWSLLTTDVVLERDTSNSTN
jgi:serine/threonine protein kinase